MKKSYFLLLSFTILVCLLNPSYADTTTNDTDTTNSTVSTVSITSVITTKNTTANTTTTNTTYSNGTICLAVTYSNGSTITNCTNATTSKAKVVLSTKYFLNRTEILTKINSARQNPSSFAALLKSNYSTFDQWTWIVGSSSFIVQEGLVAVEEAIAVLTAAQAVPALSLAQGLSTVAQYHVNSFKNNTSYTDDPYTSCSLDIAQRVSEVGKFSSIGESIIADTNDTNLIVASLLIGDGDPYRRARNDMLNAKYTHVGFGRTNSTQHFLVLDIVYAESFACVGTCPNIPSENATYNCSKPTPFTYGSAGVIKTYVSLLIICITALLY